MGAHLRVGGVVFDWDGTLADSLALFFRANAAVMAELGVPFDEATYRRHYSPDWRVAYRRLGVPDGRLDEAARLWRERFDARSGDTRPLPGAVAAVERLVGHGLSVGVVTAGDRRVVEPQIAAFGLERYVAACVYGDDLETAKPDPAPLRRALALMGRSERAAETAYVGDAPDDMRMAKAAGCPAVGIESLLGEAATLRDAGAAAVYPSVAAWVEAWLGPRSDGR
ncbi:MAG TPA: HAD-IA family hydrolase [Candidatus Limnocylindrales bacterium]|nr:HAD-IA family hydrolase [Candidatus Limnocylindrales bacterium]